jgi:hypothetical protein
VDLYGDPASDGAGEGGGLDGGEHARERSASTIRKTRDPTVATTAETVAHRRHDVKTSGELKGAPYRRVRDLNAKH